VPAVLETITDFNKSIGSKLNDPKGSLKDELTAQLGSSNTLFSRMYNIAKTVPAQGLQAKVEKDAEMTSTGHSLNYASTMVMTSAQQSQASVPPAGT